MRYKEKVKEILRSICLLPEEEWQFISSHLDEQSLKKGDFLIRPGDDANLFGFVAQGLLKRYFYSEEGEPIVISFDAENRVVSDFCAQLQRQKAQIYIEAMEPSLVLLSSVNLPTELHQRHPIWQEVGRKIAESRYIELSHRLYSLLGSDAKGRYLEFQKTSPELLERVSQKDLAAYIGVTPSSLNRILRDIS